MGVDILVLNMSREEAEEIAFQKASLRASLSIIWAADGRTEVFDYKAHPRLQKRVAKAMKKIYPSLKAEELAKLGYT